MKTLAAAPQRRSPRTSRNADRQSLAEVAYCRLEEMIVTLQLEPGSAVTEGDLAQRLGIGRTPLREAVQRLALQRLVTSLPRRGLAVSEISLTDQLGVLETRRVLDSLIASGAARRATPEQRSRLKGCAARIQQAARSGDLNEFLRVDQELERLLAEAAHNHSASIAIAPLHIFCRRFWYVYRHQGNLVKAADLHAHLATRVAAGDEEGAAQASGALLHHLDEFTRKVLDLYLRREHHEP